MKAYHYFMPESKSLLRIQHNRRPSLSTIPRSGTWLISEFNTELNRWEMGCFPEITWGTLKNLMYCGEQSC